MDSTNPTPPDPQTLVIWKPEASEVTAEGCTKCMMAAPESVMQPFVGMPLDFRFKAVVGRIPRGDAAGFAVDSQKVTGRGKACFGLLLYPVQRKVWLWFGLDFLPEHVPPQIHEELLRRFEPHEGEHVWRAVWCPMRVPFEAQWRFQGQQEALQKFRVSVGRRQMGEFWAEVGDPESNAYGIGQLMLPRLAGASFRVINDLVYHLFVEL
jgi:hypothetical protein